MPRTTPLIFLAACLVLCSTLAAANNTVVIDNRSDFYFATTGSWSLGTNAGYHVADYRHAPTQTAETATATWTPEFPSGGQYQVAVWYVAGGDRPADAKYAVVHSGGTSVVHVDQTTGGSQWVPIGQWTFPQTGGSVALSNQSAVAGKVVVADAVRFVRVGTDYGDQYQGMWAYAWGSGFLSAAQTDTLIARTRDQNMNILLPQVRKTADAYYISAIEPRGSNIHSSYADPLADILAKAHDTTGGKQRIEVHAWIVPYRVWSGSFDSLPENHVLNRNPEWRTEEYDGTTDLYNLDPGHPGVIDYLVEVITEIAENYDVDGIHLDYIRYMGNQYGYNPVALARFQNLYNRSDRPGTTDAQWSDFRRDQIRALARKAYVAAKAVRWDLKMSAATINWGTYSGNFTQTATYRNVFQDWPGFMNEGILDVNVLMNYKREHVSDQRHDYRSWLGALAEHRGGRHAVSGPGIYMNYPHNGIVQTLLAMDQPGVVGNVFYVYHQTHTNYADRTIPTSDYWAANKADCFFERRDIPSAPWIETPTFGILAGTVRVDGLASDGTSVVLSGGATGTRKTDGTGFYAFVKAAPGTGFSITATVPDHPDQTKTFEVVAGEVTFVDFDFGIPLPTPTPTPEPTQTPTPTPTPEPTPTSEPTPIPTHGPCDYTVLWEDDFEDYENNNALTAAYDGNTLTIGGLYDGPDTFTLGDRSVFVHADDTGCLTASWPGVSSMSCPVTFTFWLYDTNEGTGTNNGGRNAPSIGGWGGGAWDSGTLENFLSFGPNHGQAGAHEYYSARVVFGGNSWKITNGLRAEGWQKFAVELHAGTATFYLNDVVVYTDTYLEPPGGWNSLRIGSTAAIAYRDSWVDDVLVTTGSDSEPTPTPTPEPTPTHSLIGDWILLAN